MDKKRPTSSNPTSSALSTLKGPPKRKADWQAQSQIFDNVYDKGIISICHHSPSDKDGVTALVLLSGLWQGLPPILRKPKETPTASSQERMCKRTKNVLISLPSRRNTLVKHGEKLSIRS